MKIKRGGQSSSIKEKIYSIQIYHEFGRDGNLMINESSLSYLSVDELLDIKEEINKTLKAIFKE